MNFDTKSDSHSHRREERRKIPGNRGRRRSQQIIHSTEYLNSRAFERMLRLVFMILTYITQVEGSTLVSKDEHIYQIKRVRTTRCNFEKHPTTCVRTGCRWDYSSQKCVLKLKQKKYIRGKPQSGIQVVEAMSEATDVFDCLTSLAEHGCNEITSCTWCNSQVGMGFCLSTAVARALAKSSFFQCDTAS